MSDTFAFRFAMFVAATGIIVVGTMMCLYFAGIIEVRGFVCDFDNGYQWCNR